MLPRAEDRMALLSRLIIACIRAYQWLLRPLLPPTCRFYPSCSRYAIESISLHGGGRGSLLAAGRLLRCHPWNPGGFDPVAETLPGPTRRPRS